MLDGKASGGKGSTKPGKKSKKTRKKEKKMTTAIFPSKLEIKTSDSIKDKSTRPKRKARSSSVAIAARKKHGGGKDAEIELKKKVDPDPSSSSHESDSSSHDSFDPGSLKDFTDGASVYKGWRDSAGEGASEDGYYDPRNDKAPRVLPG